MLYNDLSADAPDTSPEVECSDECSMLHPDEFLPGVNDAEFVGWSGRESECDEKEEWYYGSKVTVLTCPRCGEKVRSEDEGYGTDEDARSERQQMGLVDF